MSQVSICQLMWSISCALSLAKSSGSILWTRQRLSGGLQAWISVQAQSCLKRDSKHNFRHGALGRHASVKASAPEIEMPDLGLLMSTPHC